MGDSLRSDHVALLEPERLPLPQNSGSIDSQSLGYGQDTLAGQVTAMGKFRIEVLERRSAPPLEPQFTPGSQDWRVAHAGAGADRPNALAVHMGFVQVTRIERRKFSGHVFNLETGDGWYYANSIVVHNCFCSVDYRLTTANEGK
jgi:hypothetical protein